MEKFIKSLLKNNNKKYAKKKILFTEGWNKTIQKVAIDLKKENIVEPILLLKNKTKDKSIKDIKQIIIDEINNDINIKRIYELRKNKNTSIEEAKFLAYQPNYLSAVLLERKKVDGVVCGYEYSTKDTMKAALKIIGVNKRNKMVSSLMFIKTIKKLFIFSDCAINLNPNANELSNIAINAGKFSYKILNNKKLNIALLSYSTNGSGSGESVNKVKDAFSIINKKKIKGLNFYGEIQFDAAINKDIRNKKIKNLKWNKDADVFIFPNLDSANIGYKILERSSDDNIAIGPIVIGLKRPMNDLSRGSSSKSIKSISYITAFQSLK